MVYDLFICVGQSNMSGRGTKTNISSLKNCYEYKVSDNSIRPFTEPSGEDFNSLEWCVSDNYSLLYSFCKKYNEVTNRTPLIVKVSEGGTSINDWVKGGAKYNDLIFKVNSSKQFIKNKNSTIKTSNVLFLQGESDAIRDMTTEEYEGKLTSLIKDYKTSLAYDNFYIIPISWLHDSIAEKKASNIMKAQNNCSKKISYVHLGTLNPFFIDETSGLYIDKVHYNSDGLDIIGTDLAITIANNTDLSIDNIKIKRNEVVNNMFIDAKDYGIKENTSAGNKDFDNSKVLQNIIDNSNGRTIIFEGLSNVLLNEPIYLPDNVKIKSSTKTRFFTNKKGNNMPYSMFVIEGSNVEIDGLFIDMNRNQLNASGKGRGIEICMEEEPHIRPRCDFDTNYVSTEPTKPGSGVLPTIIGDIGNITIKNCKILNAFYGICCFNTRLWNVRIENNRIDSIRHDVFFNNIGGENIFVNENQFMAEKNHELPIWFDGNIVIYAGYRYPAENFQVKFTNYMYENLQVKNVSVCNNKFNKVMGRAIRVFNAQYVDVNFNTVNNNIGGDRKQLGFSDDVLFLEYSTNCNVIGNTVNGSGENALDLLAVKNVLVGGNTFEYIDDYGIGIGSADVYDVGLSNDLKVDYQISENIRIVNNKIYAKYSAINVILGRNIIITNNQLISDNIHLGLCPYVSEISYASSGYPLHKPFYENYKYYLYPQTKIQNIKCSGNIINGKSNVYLGPKSTQDVMKYFVWNSIELGEELAIGENEHHKLTTNSEFSFEHRKGRYNNVKVEVYIPPSNDTLYYTDEQRIGDRWFEVDGLHTVKTDEGTWETRGIAVMWKDTHRVIIKTGDKLINIPDQLSDQYGRQLHDLKEGWVRIKTY